MTKQEMLKHIEEEMIICAGDHDLLEGMLDLECVDCDPEKHTADFKYKPVKWQCNDYGGVHGGMITTVCDYTMGLTIGCTVGAYVGTASLSVNYLKPMMGDEYLVHCTCLHPGNKICHGQAEVFDSKTGVMTAVCNATFCKVNFDPSK